MWILIPTFPFRIQQFQREEDTDEIPHPKGAFPGILSSSFPTWQSWERIFQEKGSKFFWDNPSESPIPKGKHSRSFHSAPTSPWASSKGFSEAKGTKNLGIPTFPELQFLLFRVLKNLGILTFPYLPFLVFPGKNSRGGICIKSFIEIPQSQTDKNSKGGSAGPPKFPKKTLEPLDFYTRKLS